MADGGAVRRRGEALERINYQQDLQQLRNFVDNELGNGHVPQPPDTSEWRVHRNKTIQKLNDLRERLDRFCVGTNYVNAAGNGAGALGAGGAIIGAIMQLRGIPAGQMVMDIGNLAHNAGNLIDRATNMIELFVTADYLKEIETVLKRDQELSRPLEQWLDFSRELDANVQRIFGVSLTSERWKIVGKIFYEFAQIVESGKTFNATLQLMRQGRYSVHIGNYDLVDRLQKFFNHLSAYPESGSWLRITLSVLSASTTGIQTAILGVKVYNRFYGISSSSSISTLRGGPNPEIPTAREASLFIFFQALNMANSVLRLINASNIIRNGTSKYSDALKQLTRSLKWELTQIESMDNL